MLMEAPLPIDEMRDFFFYKIGEPNQPLPSQLFKFQFLESYSVGQRQKAVRAMFTLNPLASNEPVYLVLMAVANFCYVYLNRVVTIPRPHQLVLKKFFLKIILIDSNLANSDHGQNAALA